MIIIFYFDDGGASFRVRHEHNVTITLL
jgi:HSF-type DNA-binding